MKTYVTVVRVLAMVLLFGLIVMLILFRTQNWEISPFFYAIVGLLLISVLYDSFKNR